MTSADPEPYRHIVSLPRDTAEPRPDGDPLMATACRIRAFIGHGWRFTTRLAEQVPRAYLSGWSL
ncbi:hypothetical protein [Nocardia paucivorans]|uniref:hypothetical protein n=1 Tax=Nocardia paucivorans TaxID=114259 RepID=UPI00031DF9EB|nr:hypothetical protein [Nocardia paucivorans]